MPENAEAKYLYTEKAIHLFLLVWTVLNVVQAATVGLHPDEAYYWIYSRFLDWGYFDHPPMVALFILFGDALIPGNELGLRLVNVLSSTASIYLLWLIVKAYGVKPLWFILLAGSMLTLHVYGFITTPDGPLLFFTALFFYVYRKYLEKDTLLLSILLGVVIAGLMYSKYHAILLLGFAVLANLKLLARWTFWLVVVVAVALYLPHILWQVNHDYPSAMYHLADRASKVYKFDYTSAYVLTQLLMAGPIIGWYIFYKAFTTPAADTFLRGLKVVFIGMMGFFLFTTIRGEVQAQWTIIAMAAMLLLVLIGFSQKIYPPLWVKKLAVINVALILAVRLLLIFHPPFVEQSIAVKNFFNYKPWSHTIKQKVGDNWVMMNDGFQVPSRYCYYNRTLKCFSYDSRYYRLTQFELWPMEDSVQGKRVYYVLHNATPGITTDTIQTADGPWYGGWIDSVRTYQRIRIETGIKEIKSSPGEKQQLTLSIRNPYKYPISFSNSGYKHSVVLEACFSDPTETEREIQSAGSDFNLIKLQPGQTAKYQFIITAPKQKGQYYLLFSVHTQPFNGSKNSGVISFKVE